MNKIVKIITSLLLAFLNIYSSFIIYKLDILPINYLILVLVLFLIITIIGIVCIFKKGLIKKIILILIYILSILAFGLSFTYGNNVIDFFNTSFNNIESELSSYQVLVFKNKFGSLEELSNIGYLSTDDIDFIKKNIKNNLEYKEYEDVFLLYEDLINGNISAIVLNTSYLDILEMKYELDNLNSIYSFSLKIEKEKKEEVEELKPINIFVSGSDSRTGLISNKSRSDVNMIISINPITKKVLLTSIPRDYYVQLHSKTGLKDKLTHSGVYGLDETVKTVEDLLDIKIDYSVKIGFKSVVEIIDLIGGVDIYSEKAFTSHSRDGGAIRVEVKEGMNHFNGGEALSYSRERYAYLTGDRHRVLNQQQVLVAVIKKIISDKNMLFKADDILLSLSNLYKTDIPNSVIKLLIKNQISDMSDWEISTQSLNGSDDRKPTYTIRKTNLYVMVPYEKDVKNAHDKIIDIIK